MRHHYDTSHVKIGISSRVEIRSNQVEGIPFFVIGLYSAKQIESLLHTVLFIFNKPKDSKISGYTEWFKLPFFLRDVVKLFILFVWLIEKAILYGIISGITWFIYITIQHYNGAL